MMNKTMMLERRIARLEKMCNEKGLMDFIKSKLGTKELSIEDAKESCCCTIEYLTSKIEEFNNTDVKIEWVRYNKVKHHGKVSISTTGSKDVRVIACADIYDGKRKPSNNKNKLYIALSFNVDKDKDTAIANTLEFDASTYTPSSNGESEYNYSSKTKFTADSNDLKKLAANVFKIFRQTWFISMVESRRRKCENAMVNSFTCKSLGDMIESHLADVDGYADVVDDNADNGFINIGVEAADGTQADYDVVIEDDHNIQILFADDEIARCDSLEACAKLIALHFKRMM